MATYTYNGHTYFLTNKTTWLEAQAEAKSLGGNLVTINDKAEQNWLTTTFGSVGRLWIGYTDQETEGVFKWISGESPTYTNWHYGEPNNNNYENNSEDYVHLYSDGTWNDLANSYYLFDIKGGIIEINNSSQNVPVNHAPTGNVTISGTAQAGQTLTANNTLADSDGLGTLNYQWLSNGNVISGATQSTYKLTANEVGKNMSVKVSYMDKANNAESVTSGTTNAVLKQANSLPTGNVTISGTAQVGQTLIASNNLFDADGLGTLNYQWFSNGNVISGATQTAYVLTSNEVGKNISVKVNYTDLQNNAETVTSGTTNAVLKQANSLPTGNVTISGTAQVGQTLIASNNLFDADGLGTLNYQWFSNGNVISGATQTAYVLTSNEVGKNISVKVNYTDLQNNAETVTSGTTNTVLKQANSLPTGNVTISGTAQVGQTLIASNNLFDADGLGTLNYQWLSNGNPISGATKNNYVVSTDDAGQSISVKVNYTDGKGNLENVSSSPLIIDDLPQTPPNYILWADSDYYTNRYIVVNKDGEDYYLVVNEDGESAVTFTLEISKPLKTDVTIPFRLSGTATKIKDYQGTLTETTAFTIFAGETSAHLTLTANMDTLSEKDETIILTLSNPSDGGEIIGNNDIIVIRNAFQGKNTADKWTGTKNNDIAFGNGGNDTLSGGLGDDSIDGGDGNDKITGGKGTDELTGGDGIDTFVFAKGDSFPDNVESSEINADFIVDLSKGDKIDLSSISKTFNLIKDIATDFEGSNVKLSATKFDAYIAHVYDSYYFVYETAKNGSTYEIVGIGDNEITMTFKSGIFTVV